jgi:hypothetical protein
MFYIIAVGGAGSSGRPAFDSGVLIMTNARKAMTAKPAMKLGCAKIAGSGHS